MQVYKEKSMQLSLLCLWSPVFPLALLSVCCEQCMCTGLSTFSVYILLVYAVIMA